MSFKVASNFVVKARDCLAIHFIHRAVDENDVDEIQIHHLEGVLDHIFERYLPSFDESKSNIVKDWFLSGEVVSGYNMDSKRLELNNPPSVTDLPDLNYYGNVIPGNLVIHFMEYIISNTDLVNFSDPRYQFL